MYVGQRTSVCTAKDKDNTKRFLNNAVLTAVNGIDCLFAPRNRQLSTILPDLLLFFECCPNCRRLLQQVTLSRGLPDTSGLRHFGPKSYVRSVRLPSIGLCYFSAY